MIAFRVLVNGQPSVVASQPDWSLLSFMITACRDCRNGSDDHITVNVGGLSKEMSNGISEHIRWGSTELSMGDKVEIEIIDTDTPDEPIKRYSSDPKSDDIPYYTEEERRKMLYEEYLELKAEFEPGDET